MLDMSAKPSTMKLVGVLEAMGMALPDPSRPHRPTGLSITDTRLPVGFNDDEINDHEEALASGEPEPPRAAVPEQREPITEVPATPNRGAWARARTELHPLYRRDRRNNARVRTYSVAYYRSEHALATAAAYDGRPTPAEAPRNERIGGHADVMGYRGRHRRVREPVVSARPIGNSHVHNRQSPTETYGSRRR
ncbi:hypothetical protein GCM10018962_05980 [Dactylosporangium matsuzakiense]|uniref:Uncharacterized protein n=2 Tax=Dactylosporangium matsuzakiense TaxID=53360 RepID=A0A9W6KD83_9ACTN|nr:hypothetical protein GCM10017581_003490 [Dactylosporangium matsuzakiense]